MRNCLPTVLSASPNLPKIWKALWTLCLIASSVLLVTASALADGSQTGVITGTVVDSGGQLMPGVEVRLNGPQTYLQAMTDDQGRFRFPNLEIGTYSLVAELFDLKAVKSDLRVYIDKTLDVTLPLDETPQEPLQTDSRDLIYVLAVAPLIDPQDTRVGSSIGREFLDDLPVERFYQSVALLLPGVAGGEDGNPNVNGSLRNSNLYLVDGVDTTDPTTGLFGLNLNFEAVQDVDVTTAAPPVEFGRASGAIINVVTRSGHEDYRGSARWLASNPSWDGSYAPPESGLEDEQQAAENGDDLENTLSFSLAGPLDPDRVWFFAGFENAEETFFRPTLSGETWNEDADLQSSALKVTWKAHPRHTLVGQYTADTASFLFYSAFDQSPGENRATRPPQQLQGAFIDFLPGDLAALEKRSQDGRFSKLQWNTSWGQNLALNAAVASQDRRLDREPLRQSDITGGAPHFADQPFDLSQLDPAEAAEFTPTTTLYNGITDQGFEERERDQASAFADYFLRRGKTEQEWRIGIDFQRTTSRHKLSVSGQEGIDRATGIPVEGQLFFDFDTREACFFDGICTDFDPATGIFQPNALFNYYRRRPRETEVETTAFFVNNSIRTGRWLISLGGRYETVRADDDDGRILADDTSFSPRIGIKFDPKNDGKVLISANWSRFVEPFPQLFFDDFVRDELFSGFTLYAWDADGDLDCEGADPTDLASECWVPFDSSPQFPRQFAEPNPNLDRSQVEEWVLTFERQLTENTAIRLSLIDREWLDLWDDILIGQPSDEPGFLESVDVRVDTVPQAQRTYRGVQLFLQKRFADRWQLLASYTWSEAEGNLFQNDGFSTFADYDNLTDTNRVNRLGPAPFDRTNQFKVFANYRVPLQRHRLSLGTIFRFETGLPYQRERLEPFGIRFLDPRGFERLEDFWQWDLSTTMDIALSKDMELEWKFEVFNVTNEQAQIGVDTDITFGNFGQLRSINDLQNPRHVRLSVGLRF